VGYVRVLKNEIYPMRPALIALLLKFISELSAEFCEPFCIYKGKINATLGTLQAMPDARALSAISGTSHNA